MTVEINQNNIQQLVKSVYIKDSNIVQFGEYDNKSKEWKKYDYEELFKYYMLICQGCGRGKTTYALSTDEKGLLAQINSIKEKYYDDYNTFTQNKIQYAPIPKERMTFLCSRQAQVQQFIRQNPKSAIKAKKQDYKKDNSNEFEFDIEQRKGKILVLTAHQFGEWVKKGLIEITPQVMVMDEAHSLFAERKFAESLIYVRQYLQQHYDEIIKIGLTATPEFLEYVEKHEEKFKFKRIDIDLPPKYQAKNLKVVLHTSIETIVEENKVKFGPTSKAIIYKQSATGCYRLSKRIGANSTFFISDYYDRKEEYTQEMKELGYKSKVLQEEKLPDNIYSVVMNSSCREGITIKDESVKYVYIEAVDMLTIEQVLGRLRQDMEEIIVICNFNNEIIINDEINKWEKFYKDFSQAQTDKEKQHVLALQYAEQKGNKTLPKFVYDYNKEFYVDKGAIEWLEFIKYECYAPLHNSINKQSQVFKDDNVSLVERREAYLNRLRKYSKDGKVKIVIGTKEIVEANHSNVIRKFKEIENDWLNKPIDTNQQKELCELLNGIKRTGGKIGTFRTLKPLLEGAGYHIESKATSKKRYQVISK